MCEFTRLQAYYNIIIVHRLVVSFSSSLEEDSLDYKVDILEIYFSFPINNVLNLYEVLL